MALELFPMLVKHYNKILTTDEKNDSDALVHTSEYLMLTYYHLLPTAFFSFFDGTLCAL